VAVLNINRVEYVNVQFRIINVNCLESALFSLDDAEGEQTALGNAKGLVI
jgi:hypothetical protein